MALPLSASSEELQPWKLILWPSVIQPSPTCTIRVPGLNDDGDPSARLRQFRNEKFLLLREGFQFRTAVSEAFRAARIRPAVVFESLSFGNLLAMVAVGAGVSLVPEMAWEKRKGCKFVPLSELRGVQEIGWAVLKRHVLSPAQKLFINELRNAFAGNPPARTGRCGDARKSAALRHRPKRRAKGICYR